MTESADARVRRAEALERTRAAQSREALALIAQFVEDARAAGLTTERLTARTYDGSARYKTNVTGWYLKKDRTVGVGTDGQFYVLSTPKSLKGLLSGVTMAPAEAPIELGKGGRDGESMPMADALAKRLAGGNSWGK
ncbi:hypothetical protein ON058_10780 [Demequina sp. B12]|uniref:hypothetical protein n=1 Tax=Demequina sp. B12 TaxID=2992757 RepID=UPI00237AD783|nr:hypothetical protein [Demequina sp. B12]MDE0573895.1 hypothetical protein [Demequina sp. B12]